MSHARNAIIWTGRKGAPAIGAGMLFMVLSTATSGQLPEFSLEPTVRIGSVDDLETALTKVSFLEVAPDGRLAVAQPADFSVWIFAPSGERLAVVGREGEGPGEFRNLAGLGWRGDTLWVADRRLWRVTFFPPGGRAPLVIGGANRQIDAVMSVPRPASGDGWLSRRDVPLLPNAQQYRYEFWAFESDWQAPRAIAVIPIAFDRVHIMRPDGSLKRLREQPFTDHPLFAVSPDNTSITFVDRKLSDSALDGRYSITRITISGDTLFRYERAVHLDEMTEETRMAVIDEYVAYLNVRPIGALRRSIAGSVRFPEYHPPFSKIVVGRDGSTWLRGPDDWRGTVRWLVLDELGRPVRSVVADRLLGLETMTRYGFIAVDMNGTWAVEQDEMGVEYIVRYELRPLGDG